MDSDTAATARIFREQIAPSIHERVSTFERMVSEADYDTGAPMFAKLAAEFPDFQIHIDFYYGWKTILFCFDGNRFVIFHEYTENNHSEFFLMDGQFLSWTVEVERFIFTDGRATRLCLETYLSKKPWINWFPFQFLKEGYPCEADIPIKAAAEPKLWQRPYVLMEWFEALDLKGVLHPENCPQVETYRTP